jgi:hypothetical protein
MAIDLGSAGLTVLGGAVSGGVGILYSEYRSWRENSRRSVEWFQRTARLADEIHNSVTLYHAQGKGLQLIDVCNTYSSQVREHRVSKQAETSAPFEEALERTVILSRAVGEMEPIHINEGQSTFPAPQNNIIEELKHESRALVILSREHAESVGWF